MTLKRLLELLEERLATAQTDIHDAKEEGNWFHNSYGAGYDTGYEAGLQTAIELAKGDEDA